MEGHPENIISYYSSTFTVNPQPRRRSLRSIASCCFSVILQVHLTSFASKINLFIFLRLSTASGSRKYLQFLSSLENRPTFPLIKEIQMHWGKHFNLIWPSALCKFTHSFHIFLGKSFFISKFQLKSYTWHPLLWTFRLQFTKSGFYPQKCSATKVIAGKLNKGNFFNALNIIITSQHDISLSVIEIISCSLWILNAVFYWLYLSVSFFNLSGNAWSWEWTNA